MSPKGLQHNFGVIYYAVRWASDAVQAGQRGDNYDEHSEFAERIRRDYDDHGIPRWRAQ
jgi:hypothetical protein